MQYAIVTPYYKESVGLLQRCIASVQHQTIQVDQLLIADGHAQDWIDFRAERYLRLDHPHGNYGNTPRGIGLMLAFTEQYNGIGVLDADNWLEANHVEVCVLNFNSVSKLGKVDYVIAKRHLRRPDETTIETQDEPTAEHVDTNCFFFLPDFYHIVQYFEPCPKRIHRFSAASSIKPCITAACNLRFATSPQSTTTAIGYRCIGPMVKRRLKEPNP
ncbi:MAG: hypothetical protein H7Y28_02005 [Rhodoferax sp.]|nr:hypothetical protein [Rhodoferax sp.]